MWQPARHCGAEAAGLGCRPRSQHYLGDLALAFRHPPPREAHEGAMRCQNYMCWMCQTSWSHNRRAPGNPDRPTADNLSLGALAGAFTGGPSSLNPGTVPGTCGPRPGDVDSPERATQRGREAPGVTREVRDQGGPQWARRKAASETASNLFLNRHTMARNAVETQYSKMRA